MIQIKKSHLDFLRELKENNNKEWFAINKDRYLAIKKEIDLFWEHFFSKINEFDEYLQNPWEKLYTFRIYRDARFAKNNPYKTNFWLLVWPWWKAFLHLKSWYYLNIEPWNCFLVWGIWRPEASILQKIRKSINNDSSELKEIIENNEFKKYFRLDWEKVNSAPKWYKKNHKDIDLLKYKDFYAIMYFSDEEVLDKDFLEKIAKLSKILYPFSKYLNSLK